MPYVLAGYLIYTHLGQLHVFDMETTSSHYAQQKLWERHGPELF